MKQCTKKCPNGPLQQQQQQQQRGLDVWDAWSFFKLLDLDSGGAVEAWLRRQGITSQLWQGLAAVSLACSWCTHGPHTIPDFLASRLGNFDFEAIYGIPAAGSQGSAFEHLIGLLQFERETAVTFGFLPISEKVVCIENSVRLHVRSKDSFAMPNFSTFAFGFSGHPARKRLRGLRGVRFEASNPDRWGQAFQTHASPHWLCRAEGWRSIASWSCRLGPA